MKKLLCAILIFATAFGLISCSQSKYEPRESTEEELRVVMTVSVGDTEYDIKYELYRALYLNCAADYNDRGEGFFATDEGKAAIDDINARVIDLCGDIYSSIHLANELGFDAYSAAVDEKISDMIADDVNNEYYAGDYEKYLSDLAKLNMNYAVQDLMLRYQLAYDHIVTHYTGTLDFDHPTSDMQEGAIKYTKEDVSNFYYSDKALRISVVTVSGALAISDAQRIRDNIAAKGSISDALNYAISCTISDPSDVLDGVIIGTESVDYVFYGDVKAAAESLAMGDVSEVIEISNDLDKEYWILIRTDKDSEHFEECYDNIASAYVSQRIGEIIKDVKTEICDSVIKTDVFSTLTHDNIKMQ